MLGRGLMQAGVTLVELAIGLAIFAILVSRALPSFTSWLQNQQIRNAAESMLNGLQLARAHAVKSNAATDFVLTTAEPISANVNDSASHSKTGANWMVRASQTDGKYQFIQGRAGMDGSKNAAIKADQAQFTFSPLGRLLNPSADRIAIDVDSALTYENQRKMRILVYAGGQMLMCDPAKVDASNPQFCPE